MSEWWRYENLESNHPYDWAEATRGNHPDDNIDFHLDLGAGSLPKARLTLDSRGEPDIKLDLNTMDLLGSKEPLHQSGRSLPFPDDSIESIITHHCLEHVGDGFIRVMDECYRVLVPQGKFRIIVPLFPSLASVNDPDHCRYFCIDTFESFVHDAGLEVPFWSESFSTPYTSARFKLAHKDYTPPETLGEMIISKNPKFSESIEDYEPLMNFGCKLTVDDFFAKGREIRVTLQKP